MLHAFGVTDRGRIRPTNEDCFGIDHDLQLCVVADGMGGHNAGEVASRMAVEAVLDYVANRRVTTTWPFGYDQAVSERSNLLRTAVQVANASVFERAASTPSCAGMGTTVAAIMADRDVLTVAHVGDSRVYAMRDGRAEALTSDDSWAAVMLARDPSIDPGVLKAHPMRNALTSVVGSRPTVAVHLLERTLGAGELLVLTTDGVHGVLCETTLAQICARTASLQDAAARLVEAAIGSGSRDNCTAVVARYTADI
jgi:protein phosphatase